MCRFALIPPTAPIHQSLIRFWPWRSSSKQVIFLNELEEVLELLTGPDQITEVEDQLFNLLARCISSDHFQVKTLWARCRSLRVVRPGIARVPLRLCCSSGKCGTNRSEFATFTIGMERRCLQP